MAGEQPADAVAQIDPTHLGWQTPAGGELKTPRRSLRQRHKPVAQLHARALLGRCKFPGGEIFTRPQ
jgi:hypothetical protein